jgi:sterol desaturase/sphingolipid hydroxylase (fatty acid hydroxylase superfamily)
VPIGGYRSGREVLGEAAFFLVRSSLLCAFVTVFVVHHPAVLPALLSAVKRSSAVAELLRTNPATQWLQRAFFDGCTPDLAAGLNLLDALLFVAIFVAIHEAVFWGVGGFFLLCDATGLLAKYKLPRTPRMRISPRLFARTVATVAANHFGFQPWALFLLYRYASSYPSMYAPDGTPAAAPAFATCFGFFLLAQLVGDGSFYCVHRVMHAVPWLYRNVHSQHHAYSGTVGYAAQFSHPLEWVFANHIPTLGPMTLASAWLHPSIIFVWLGYRIWQTTEIHSGYDLRGSLMERAGLTVSRQTEFHDWHHTHSGNYGWEWQDWLGGTMGSFAAMKRGGCRSS